MCDVRDSCGKIGRTLFCNREGSGSDHVTQTPGSLEPLQNPPRGTSRYVNPLSQSRGSHLASFYMGQKGRVMNGLHDSNATRQSSQTLVHSCCLALRGRDGYHAITQ